MTAGAHWTYPKIRDVLRGRVLTTVEIAKETQRTPRSVHAQLGQFLERGLVERAGIDPLTDNRGRGRPAVMWKWVGA
jgi:predicted ArsR family transcriptional regulator